MHRRSYFVAAAAALLGIGGAGRAAAQVSINVRADIPFEFVAGSTTMPAGQYSLTRGVSPAILLVRSEDGRSIANILANAAIAKEAPAESQLVFNKYGDRYFLAQIWTAGQDLGCQLVKQRMERELSQRAGDYQRVIILAKR